MWPAQYPPVSGSFRTTHYDRIIALWSALRERQAIISNATEWPMGQDPWSTPGQSGIINTLTTSGSNLRLTDAGKDPDFNPDWIDSSSIKRWTSFAGTWYGSTIDPTPSQFRVVIYPPDTGTPSATAMGDPRWGVVFDIEDNGENWIEFFNDGTMFLNGKTLSDYAGYRYQIIRQGGGTRNGVGWVDRFPWYPNDKEIYSGEITSSGTTFIVDARVGTDDQWDAPVDFTAYVGRDVVFKDGNNVWRRRTIATAVATVAGGLKNKITFASVPAAPAATTYGYWIVDIGKFWLPRCRIEMVHRHSRQGKYWQPSGFTRPWFAGGAWNNTFAEGYISHSAEFDDLAPTPIPVDSIEVDPGPPPTIVTTFDFDGRTSDTDASLPENQDGHLFSRRLFWGNRGLQVGIELTKGSAPWVEPRDYDGATAIPDWTLAGWFKYFVAANTCIVTIISTTARDGGDATISTTLPYKTPAEQYPSLPCTFTIYDADGNVKYDSQGTVTATTITDVAARGFIDHLPVGAGGDGDTDVGLTCVVAFCSDSGASGNRDNGSWTRRHARLVKYIYPRTYWQPESTDHPGMSEDHPGTYETNDVSTEYAEFTKYGILEENGGTFKTDELAYYEGDSFEHPTTQSKDGTDVTLPIIDVAFQGIPNNDTPFPRWEGFKRFGLATGGGTNWLEDTSQLWWCAATYSQQHTGTGTAGSSASVLIDSTKTGNGYWDVTNRFLGMILEVELDPVGAAGVYSRSPITAYDYITKSVTVSPAFASTTFNKQYRIREPGADPTSGGIIVNLWKGRRLKVTHHTDSTVHYCDIINSDDTRLYFASNALTFAVSASDKYEIIQIEAGQVVARKPTSTDPLKTQSGWLGGYVKGTKPTICTSYGKYRKRDYTGLHFWTEAFKGIDALRWILHGMSWNGKGETGLSWAPGTDVGLTSSVANSAAYAAAFTSRTGLSESLWEGGAPSAGTFDATDPPLFGTSAQTDRAYPYGEGSDFELFVDINGSQQSYGKADGFPTDKLNFDCVFFAQARCFNGARAAAVSNTANTGSGNAAFIFNAFGSGFAYNQFKNLETISTGWPSRVMTTKVGPTPLDGPPVWTKPLDPTLYDIPVGASEETNSASTGFMVNRQVTILKFDVTGGLTYVTH